MESAAGDAVSSSIYEYASKFPDASSAGKWMDRATEAGELLLQNSDGGASLGTPHTPSVLDRNHLTWILVECFHSRVGCFDYAFVIYDYE